MNKLEKQTIQTRPEQYDLCGQLRECALQFKEIWEKKDIDFEVDVEEHSIICADSGLLELVWTNLLSKQRNSTNKPENILLL